MRIGSRHFDFSERTAIMGILNVTPDSFSDGGQYNGVEAALRQAEAMIEEGADIIDVGGESTRPGHQPVEAAEELSRIIPVIEAIRKRFDIPLSVDTSKAAVADGAIQAGANLINDIWGFKAEPEIAAVVAKHGAVCCLTHNRRNKEYGHFIYDVIEDLWNSIHIAEEAGVRRANILIDPGLGFAKDYEHNLYLLNNLERLHTFGCPILLGASRKSFIGRATGKAETKDRDVGTAATTVMGIMKGCQMIRVHNVAVNKEAAMMADSVMKRGVGNG